MNESANIINPPNAKISQPSSFTILDKSGIKILSCVKEIPDVKKTKKAE